MSNAFKILSRELPIYYNPFMPQLLFDATLINSGGSAVTYDPRKKWSAFDTDVFRTMWYRSSSWDIPRFGSTLVFAGITNPPSPQGNLHFYTDLEGSRPGFYSGSLVFYKIYPALASLLPYPQYTKLGDVDDRHLVLPPSVNYDLVAQYIYNRQLLHLLERRKNTPYLALQSFSRSRTGVRFTERGVPRERSISAITNSRHRNARRAAGIPEEDLNKNVGDYGTNAPSGWMPRLYVGTTKRSADVYKMFYGKEAPDLDHVDGNPANDNITNLVHADGSPLPELRHWLQPLWLLSDKAKTYFAPDWLRCPQEIIEYRAYRLHGDDRLAIHPDVLDEEYERITSQI